MKTTAYKIKCRTNHEAITIAKHLEENNINPDERDGDTLFLSKESLDMELIDQEDIVHILEDANMEYELDHVPDIEIEDHEWEEEDLESRGPEDMRSGKINLPDEDGHWNHRSERTESNYLRYRDDGGSES